MTKSRRPENPLTHPRNSGIPLAKLQPGTAAFALPTCAPGDDRMRALAADPLRTLYERGLTLAALGDLQEALDALRLAASRATETSPPDSAAIWRKLGGLLETMRDPDGASSAYATAAEFGGDKEQQPRPVKPSSASRLDQAAKKFEAQCRLSSPEVAELLLRQHLHAQPEDAAAMKVIANLWIAQHRYPEAERLLERAIEIAPGYTGARHMLAVVLFRQGHAARAAAHAERVLESDRSSIPVRTLLASCLAMSGDYARAIAGYESIIAQAPRLPTVWQSYGNALKSAGRRDDAVRAYRRCVALAPQLGEAYWSIANFKTERFSEAEIDSMRIALRSSGLSAEDRLYLHYSLGRALEQDGEFEDSFTHYAEGARIRKREVSYSADATTAQIRRAMQLFTASFFEARAGTGCMDADPIFVLGLPRAGSTLIEQILSSHSQVEGTLELPEIIAMARELGGRDGRAYPQRVADLDAAQLAALGARYIADTRAYRSTKRPFFVDKMPGNWEHVGLIRLILPNAKIIDARRDPMANCFAAFKQLFSALDYSYDLTDLGRYYRDYAAMMAHWDEVQPGAVHRVMYEDVVADTGAPVRRLLDFCGLEFEPACLRFWETKRAVSTASSEQVRQPIFREGLDQWRNYEPWLEPLKKALNG